MKIIYIKERSDPKHPILENLAKRPDVIHALSVTDRTVHGIVVSTDGDNIKAEESILVDEEIPRTLKQPYRFFLWIDIYPNPETSLEDIISYLEERENIKTIYTGRLVEKGEIKGERIGFLSGFCEDTEANALTGELSEYGDITGYFVYEDFASPK